MQTIIQDIILQTFVVANDSFYTYTESQYDSRSSLIYLRKFD